MSTYPVAAIQMCSSHRLEDNLSTAETLVAEAAEAGCRLVLLPENFSCMPRYEAERLEVAENPADGPVQAFCSRLAREHGLWLVAGTIPLLCDVPERVRAASLVYDDQGEQVARYDKIHLFDVSLNQPQDERREQASESYRESDSIAPGKNPCVVDTPVGCVGLSVCYDLRFPELYRAMVDAGATLFCVPAAFTYPTGEAHWQVLLRARAIENQALVIAAAQQGTHSNGRATWGHACIIDAWGRVLGQREQAGPGVVCAQFDTEQQSQLRERFDVLSHRRLFIDTRESMSVSWAEDPNE